MKSINQWASIIAEYEGKKHQASVGDIREILRIIIYLDLKGSNILDDLCALSDKQFEKKIKTPKKKAQKVK
jgi:predicted transcriptional regulator